VALANLKITVLGLGAMGTGMAKNLLAAGLLHSAWNRSSARAEQFAEQTGVRPAVDAVEAIAGCDVIVSCVSADEDLLALAERLLPVLNTGMVWVDCSTVAVQTAQQLATQLAKYGVAFVDAPVSGGQEGAEKGMLAIMAGAEAGVFEQLEPLWRAIGARWQRMGSVGAGQATKAVNQIMAAGINQAVSDAMAFAEAQQLPIEKVVEVVGNGAAGNWFVQHRGVTMTQAEFTPGFKVALHHKDLKICQQMAQQSGAPTAVIDSVLSQYAKLIDAGYGEEDISALYRLKSN